MLSILQKLEANLEVGMTRDVLGRVSEIHHINVWAMAPTGYQVNRLLLILRLPSGNSWICLLELHVTSVFDVLMLLYSFPENCTIVPWGIVCKLPYKTACNRSFADIVETVAAAQSGGKGLK